MRVSSIISEYNPFHQGHKYHMENTKKITNCDYTIVLMSGDFTQRGTPAILDKYARTKQALLNGADLVLELPVAFATSSAEASKGKFIFAVYPLRYPEYSAICSLFKSTFVKDSFAIITALKY